MSRSGASPRYVKEGSIVKLYQHKHNMYYIFTFTPPSVGFSPVAFRGLSREDGV